MKRRARAGGVFTAVIQKRGQWYVAYVEEIPGVNTQGRSLAEARRNLRAALREVLEANRELAERTMRVAGRARIQREPVTV